MKKIWFRVGMEAEVTDEELKELKEVREVKAICFMAKYLAKRLLAITSITSEII